MIGVNHVVGNQLLVVIRNNHNKDHPAFLYFGNVFCLEPIVVIVYYYVFNWITMNKHGIGWK